MINKKQNLNGYVFISVLLLIIIVILLLPWIDGVIFKQNYLNFLANLSRESQTEIKVVQYRLGWIQSHARLSVTIKNGLNDQKPPIVFLVEQDIFHGPIVYDRAQQKYRIAEAVIQSRFHYDKLDNFNLPISLPQLKVQTLATFSNGYDNFFEVAPYHFQIPTVMSLDWQGLASNIFLQTESNHLSGINTDFNLHTLTASAASVSMTLQSIIIKSHLLLPQDGIWQGEDTFTIPGFTLNYGDKAYVLSEYKIHSTYGNNALNHYGAEMQMSLQRLTLPEITINPSQFNFSLKNLNTKILKQMMAVLNTPENQATQEMAQYHQLLPQLIMQNTSFNSDLKLSTSKGDANAQVKITWPPNAPLPTTFIEVAHHLDGKLNARISIAFLNYIIQQLDENRKTPLPADNAAGTPPGASAGEQLNSLIQQGFIVQNKTDYVIVIQMQNGVLKINDKQVPLPF